MAKRTSWDQKAKGIHKTRQKIIDTVFGRDDNTQKVFGYEGEAQKKHKVGERWIDKDGKEWEQKEGYIVSVSKFDEIRNYLNEISNCTSTDCKTINYDKVDKKLISKTSLCWACLQKIESKLRLDGSWPYYEDYKITCNKLSFANEMKDKYEEALRDISNTFEMVNEDGTISNWQWDIDINVVKKDIQTDLDYVIDSIKKLKNRKKRLEKKIKDLGHQEIIK